MLSKNTIIELWASLTDVPTRVNSGRVTVIDDDFLGWRQGTDVEEIWHWFDDQYAAFGGVHALMYDNPEPDRRFQVWTPHGILEAYSKHGGLDAVEDYPGICIGLRVTWEQKTGDVEDDLVCQVEYDPCEDVLQIVPYADMDVEEPSEGIVPDRESPIMIITGYEGCLEDKEEHNDNTAAEKPAGVNG